MVYRHSLVRCTDWPGFSLLVVLGTIILATLQAPRLVEAIQDHCTETTASLVFLVERGLGQIKVNEERRVLAWFYFLILLLATNVVTGTLSGRCPSCRRPLAGHRPLLPPGQPPPSRRLLAPCPQLRPDELVLALPAEPARDLFVRPNHETPSAPSAHLITAAKPSCQARPQLLGLSLHLSEELDVRFTLAGGCVAVAILAPAARQ